MKHEDIHGNIRGKGIIWPDSINQRVHIKSEQKTHNHFNLDLRYGIAIEYLSVVSKIYPKVSKNKSSKNKANNYLNNLCVVATLGTTQTMTSVIYIIFLVIIEIMQAIQRSSNISLFFTFNNDLC